MVEKVGWCNKQGGGENSGMMMVDLWGQRGVWRRGVGE